MPSEKKNSKKISAAEQYIKLKKQHDNEIVFFQCGEFYEVMFDDAIKASHLLNINLTKRGKYNDKDIPLCGIPKHTRDIYVNKLLKQNHKVVVYEQEENYENFLNIGVKDRKLQRIFTPGTVTDEDLLLNHRNNFLLCIYNNKQSIGISIVDISTGEVFCKETNLKELESVLVQWNPVEILLIKEFCEKYNEQLIAWQTQLTCCDNDYFQIADSIYDDYFDESFNQSIYKANNEINNSLKGLLKYIDYTKCFNNKQLQTPKILINSEFLNISKNSRTNLELSQTTLGEKDGSLLSVLNNTVTAFGSRWMNKQLIAPLTNQKEIELRLDYVEFFIIHSNFAVELANQLSEITDLERCTYRITTGCEKKSDYIKLLDGLISIDRLICTIVSKKESCELLNLIKSIHLHIKKLHNIFEKNITSDINNIINKDGNEEFAQLSSKYDQAQLKIIQLAEIYKQETKAKSLKIKHQSGLGYFIEINTKDVGKMEYSYSLIQSLSSSKRYITPALDDLNALSQQLIADLTNIEKDVLQKIKDIVVKNKKIFNACYLLLSKLDAFIGFSKTAKLYGFSRPKFSDQTCLDINSGYHLAIASNKIEFKSNNCQLNSKQQIMFLTGPNMSGKSTYMRQNAQIIILAQIGSFVPAKTAKMNITDAIYTRIGAYDDISSGRSTFMCEMEELSYILHNATNRSFIILDEIGRGTTPIEGRIIAQSVLEYISKKNNVRTIFATHFGQIGKKLQEQFSNITCKCMKSKNIGLTNIKYLYELDEGISDYSYGIAVAKQAGLQDEIIQRAMNLYKDEKCTGNHTE